MKHTKLLLLATSAIVLTGCTLPWQGKDVVQEMKDKTTEAVAQKISEQMFASISDPLVRKHLAAQFSQRAYRMITTTSGRMSTKTTVDIAMSGSSAGMHSLIEANGKTTSEMIILGDTTYVKDLKDNAWWKQKAQPTQSSAPEMQKSEDFSPDELLKAYQEKSSAVTYKQIGKEPCDTMTCYKYEEYMGEEKEPDRTFWFDDKEYLLRKEERKIGTTVTTVTYVYSNVTVSEPSPTKDVPEGKSAYEMIYSGMMPSGTGTGPGTSSSTKPSMSDEEIKKMMEQYGQSQ